MKPKQHLALLPLPGEHVKVVDGDTVIGTLVVHDTTPAHLRDCLDGIDTVDANLQNLNPQDLMHLLEHLEWANANAQFRRATVLQQPKENDELRGLSVPELVARYFEVEARIDAAFPGKPSVSDLEEFADVRAYLLESCTKTNWEWPRYLKKRAEAEAETPGKQDQAQDQKQALGPSPVFAVHSFEIQVPEGGWDGEEVEKEGGEAEDGLDFVLCSSPAAIDLEDVLSAEDWQTHSAAAAGTDGEPLAGADEDVNAKAEANSNADATPDPGHCPRLARDPPEKELGRPRRPPARPRRAPRLTSLPAPHPRRPDGRRPRELLPAPPLLPRRRALRLELLDCPFQDRLPALGPGLRGALPAPRQPLRLQPLRPAQNLPRPAAPAKPPPARAGPARAPVCGDLNPLRPEHEKTLLRSYSLE